MFVGLRITSDYNTLVKQPVANQMKPVSVLTVLWRGSKNTASNQRWTQKPTDNVIQRSSYVPSSTPHGMIIKQKGYEDSAKLYSYTNISLRNVIL